MQNAYIISNNICHVNIDVTEDVDIVIKSISGILRTPVLKKGDYYVYENDAGELKKEECRDNIYTQLMSFIIQSMFQDILEYDSTTNLYTYKHTIVECSTRFKYILGISKLPVKKGERTQTQPFGNGPSFMAVTCDRLKGSGVLSPNVYAVDSVFQLQGPGFSGNDLRDLTFRIVGLYGEDIEIEDDLLWEFGITKKSENQNKHLWFENQYI